MTIYDFNKNVQITYSYINPITRKSENQMNIDSKKCFVTCSSTICHSIN